MNRFHILLVGLVCLGIAGGCDRSKDVSQSDSTTADEQAAATGTLKVLGSGADLYHVFDAAGENKIDFTRTGASLEVPAGQCLVVLNGARQQAIVKAGELTELQTGKLQVAGIGKDLYEVYDDTATNKLNFTRTNNPLEIFEGSYVVRLNNSSQKVSVRPGEETIVAAGSVTVEGDGKDLYDVYDEQGANKLGFTGTGKTMELLPGSYIVMYNQKNYPVTLKVKEKTTVTPD